MATREKTVLYLMTNHKPQDIYKGRSRGVSGVFMVEWWYDQISREKSGRGFLVSADVSVFCDLQEL